MKDHGFGALDRMKVTGPWKGVEWRFSPHLETDVSKLKNEGVTEVRFKSNAIHEFFNSDLTIKELIPETCSTKFPKNFGAPQNQNTNFTLTV